MLAELSASQFVEWQAYFNVEPFGAALIDLHFATLEAQFYNANRKKGAREREPKYFQLHKKSEKLAGLELFKAMKAALTFSGNLKKDE